MSVELQRRLFTVDEYHAMARAGVLTEDDRVELVGGEIVETTPIGSRHAACVDRLTKLLVRAVADRAIVRVQNPVRLDDRNEPEPDVALLRPRRDYYAGSHPGPDDVLLLIEVAESSVAYDREVKLPHYARSGVPEVWLVDLVQDVVTVHREPAGGVYAVTRGVETGDVVGPLALPEIEVSVREVLPGERSEG